MELQCLKNKQSLDVFQSWTIGKEEENFKIGHKILVWLKLRGNFD